MIYKCPRCPEIMTEAVLRACSAKTHIPAITEAFPKELPDWPKNMLQRLELKDGSCEVLIRCINGHDSFYPCPLKAD